MDDDQPLTADGAERRTGPDRRTGWSPEVERARIARELHDEVLQLMLAAVQHLQLASDGDAEALARAEQHLTDAVAQVRRVIAEGEVPVGDV